MVATEPQLAEEVRMPEPKRPVRYVPVTILVPEGCLDEVREFFERKKTGPVTLHVVRGDVLGTDCIAQNRARPREPV